MSTIEDVAISINIGSDDDCNRNEQDSLVYSKRDDGNEYDDDEYDDEHDEDEIDHNQNDCDDESNEVICKCDHNIKSIR